MDLPATARPGDPLAQPTRARLFAILAELKRPAGTAELASRLDMHPNGIRLHLERLAGAGLVLRSSAPQPRGRPRDAWRIDPSARPGGDAPSGYEQLSRWLARSIPAQPSRLRDAEAAGRRIGREMAPTGAADVAVAVGDAFAALGFQPASDRSAHGEVVFSLGNCPYRDAVRENQAVVCTLHRGITQGLLDVLDSQARLRDFEPKDPDTAGCRVAISSTRRRDRDVAAIVPHPKEPM